MNWLLRLLTLKSLPVIVLSVGTLGYIGHQKGRIWWEQWRKQDCQEQLAEMERAGTRAAKDGKTAADSAAKRGAGRVAAAREGDITPESLTSWYASFYLR